MIGLSEGLFGTCRAVLRTSHPVQNPHSLLLARLLPIFFKNQTASAVLPMPPKHNTYRQLARLAQEARLLAYAPYSNFRVGAALLSSDGTIFSGCNIENSSYSLTICAERTAIFKAVSEGVRDFSAIAIASDDPGFTPPCGSCRQVLYDLAGDIDIILINNKNQLKLVSLKSLLPMAFTSKNLKRSRREK